MLVALLAPYLRKFGQFTTPDFIGARYGGNLASFTYVTAQIYGVGIVTSRFVDIAFEAGVFGIPAGFLTIVVASLLTPAPDASTGRLVEQIRYPVLGSGGRFGDTK